MCLTDPGPSPSERLPDTPSHAHIQASRPSSVTLGVAGAAGGAGRCARRRRGLLGSRRSPPFAGGAGTGGQVEAGPCSEGATQPCGVRLATHGDVVTCLQGTQSCKGGVWQSCGNGRTIERRLPSGSKGRSHPQAIGDASPCVNNPCDPFCWNYPNEVPDSPFRAIVADGGSVYDWQAGSPGSLPPALVGTGMKEPCESALDCQFNHHCDHVATDTSCAHNKCLTGAALSATCAQNDSCVSMICSQRSTCCGDSCAHDLCSTGVKLDSTCSPCVASICAAPATAHCCTTGAWDAACVNAVSTTCAPVTCGCGPGKIANPATGHCYLYDPTNRTWNGAKTACEAQGAGWTLVSIGNAAENTFVRSSAGSAAVWIGYQKVGGLWQWLSGDPNGYLHWDSGEPNNSDICAAMRPATDFWHDWSCANTGDAVSRGAFCEGPMQLSGRAWDATCASMVDSVCSATCGSGAGSCEPWLPGETDPACAGTTGIDLALGIPCAPPDKTVPVCNHGTVAAPAGIEVAVFPAGSSQYPSCTPDMGQQVAGAPCVTTEPIPAGECVNITCDKLTNGSQDRLMVNPPGTAHQQECTCLDNLAIYDSSVACGVPACGGNAFRATFKRVNLFVIMNRAASMGAKWTGAVSALSSFFQDPGSTGVGVALEFFPIEPNKSAGSWTSGDGCPSTSCTTACAGCDWTRCTNPMVPLAPLAFYPAPNDTHEDRLVQALTVGTFGNAPSHPALEGMLSAAISAADPNNVTAVIFATDGEPDECLVTDVAQTNAAMGDLASSALNEGVSTHTIRFEGANCAALNAIAAAGGTTQARVVAGATAATVQANLGAALRAIAAESVSCSFGLPVVGTFNLNNVTVTYTPPSGTPQALSRVQSAADCGSGGWYFNNNTAPTTITLCPSTCTTLRNNFGAEIDVELGCPVPLSTTALTEIYEGVCPDASGAQWNFLSYDSDVPPNTSLHFAARTAGTLAELGNATFHPIAAVPTDPEVCTIGVSNCPADLFQALGPTDSRLRYLELAMTFTPTSNGLTAPTVNNWQIYYSCLANQ